MIREVEQMNGWSNGRHWREKSVGTSSREHKISIMGEPVDSSGRHADQRAQVSGDARLRYAQEPAVVVWVATLETGFP
jgi:hypothetical protein